METEGRAATGPARRARSSVALVLAGIPIALLAISASSWLRIAIDLPVSDDWRAYIGRSVLSVDPAWYLLPQNDTIYPVGKILDVVAHITLGGNSVVYQLVTMLAVLGGFLAMQWRLLRWAFGDLLHTAVVFSLCSLMLMAGTYWGEPNMAYHQVVPLVAIMATLVIALRPAPPSGWATVAALALGLVAGLTYVSGAFGALAAGITMVGIGIVGRIDSRDRVFRVGAGLALGGLVTVAIQLLATRLLQGETMVGGSLVMPWEPDFWFFMAGKVGASIGTHQDQPRLALALTLLAVAATAVAIAWALGSLLRKPPEPPRSDVVSVTMLTLTATVFVYLMIVSAARAQSWPTTGSGPLGVFQTGFFRFHFFWVTLIWPWVGAVALALMLGWARRWSTRLRSTALALAVAAPLTVALMAFSSDRFDYSRFYGQWAGPRLELYRCLLKNAQGDDGQGCYGLPPDLGDLIGYASSIDASWVKYLQTVPLIPPGDPLFSLRDPSTGSLRISNAEVTRDDAGLHLRAADDVQLIVEVADAEAMQRCRSLEVRSRLRPSEGDVAQVFYLRSGDEAFSTDRVDTASIDPSDEGWDSTTHILFSQDGFADTIRFDPVLTPQAVDVTDLEVYCRLSTK